MDEGGHARVVQRHRLAAQQILNFHFTDGRRLAAAVNGCYRVAQHMDTPSRGRAQLQNLTAALRRQVLNGHDHICYRRVVKNLADLINGTQHRNAVDALVPLLGGVVNDAVGLEPAIDVVIQIVEQRGTRRAAAYDGGVGLPRLVDAGSIAAVDAVDKTIGQHDQQCQRRTGQSATDPGAAHTQRQIHGAV